MEDAIKPKKAINLLWESGFFKEHRTTKEVQEKVYGDFGCRAKNWPDLLSKCRDIIMKEKKRWVQRIDPIIKGVQVVMIESGKPMTARKTFEDAVSDFEDEVSICDPYLTKTSIFNLTKFKAKRIRFLFFKKDDKLDERDILDFKKEHPHVELKRFPHPHLHDRYILNKDKLLIIGHGLGLGDKESFIIRIEKSLGEDIIQSLYSIFNTRWKSSENI